MKNKPADWYSIMLSNQPGLASQEDDLLLSWITNELWFKGLRIRQQRAGQ
ncbi:hypothetical protein [Vibrio aerogenes]|nr:hypothetical protein [Vibrio aerogenes]